VKKIIADLRKNARETLRIELDEFQGRQLISARTWYDDRGTLKPTPKGLSVEIRHLPDLRRALELAERIAQAAGLLDG
jgi:hypothetical protein